MAEQSIGGFFATVGIRTDENSVRRSQRALGQVENSTRKLVGSVLRAGAAYVSLKAISGKTETAELKLAKAIGISTKNLDKWKVAAATAGTSAGALTASMAALENKMQHLKVGQYDESLGLNLGMLGINYGDFAKMNADQRMAAVFNKAGGMADQQKAAMLVQDTLGQAGRDYYDWLKLSGKSLESQMRQAQRLTFTNAGSKKNSLIFGGELNAVGAGLKSMASFAGSAIAKELTPVVQKFKEWLMVNREIIKSGIQGLATGMGNALKKIGTLLGKLAPLATKITKALGGLDTIIVKIGIGLAGWKIAQIAGGVFKIVQSVGALKGALMGLGAATGLAAITLLLDDLMVYFTGGDSVIGLIISKLPEIKEKFKDMVPQEYIDKFVEGIKSIGVELDKLARKVGARDGAIEGLKKFGDWVANGLMTALSGTIRMVSDLCAAIGHLVKGEWRAAWNEMKNLGRDFVNSNVSIVTGESIEESERRTGMVPTVNDGIIKPNGSVVQVAPDDWVIAARNLGDVASGFLPHAAGYSANVNAPAQYSITQNITVNGGSRDLPQAVRLQAYNGANNAMQNSINRATEIQQLMPGLR